MLLVVIKVGVGDVCCIVLPDLRYIGNELSGSCYFRIY